MFSSQEAFEQNILFDINGYKNYTSTSAAVSPIKFKIDALAFEQYRKAFESVQCNLNQGNSYLVNLTFPTKIELKTSLEELFHAAKAPYRLWVKDQL